MEIQNIAYFKTSCFGDPCKSTHMRMLALLFVAFLSLLSLSTHGQVISLPRETYGSRSDVRLGILIGTPYFNSMNEAELQRYTNLIYDAHYYGFKSILFNDLITVVDGYIYIDSVVLPGGLLHFWVAEEEQNMANFIQDSNTEMEVEPQFSSQ